MDFNLQDYLHDMRKEQREDHESLTEKVDKVLEVTSDHETRIVVVENTRKLLLWAAAAVATGGLGMLFNALGK